MGTVLEVMAGESSLSDLILDMLVETHEKGDVASFRHNGKKKKGIVVGKKGEHIVVARGRERHMVKNGESQRMMEAAEIVEALELDPIHVESVLNEAADALDEDGTVDLSNSVLLERLTPRQLRFLFATGAFAAGKAAGRAALKVSAVPHPATGRFGGLSRSMAQKHVRSAAKQAMSQQLKSYKAIKKTALFMAGAGTLSGSGGKIGSPSKTMVGVARVLSRVAARQAVR